VRRTPIFLNVLKGMKSDLWVCGVDEKFHCLSGETMTFSQDGLLPSGDDFANLKASLAPPANRRHEKIDKMSFFNEEEYGKRLFGNA